MGYTSQTVAKNRLLTLAAGQADQNCDSTVQTEKFPGPRPDFIFVRERKMPMLEAALPFPFIRFEI